MAGKEETRKCTADNLSCTLCTKFVKILRHKSQDDTDDETEEVKCDDCGSDDPVVALCINCTLCLCEDCNKCHRKKNKTHDVVLLDEGKLKNNILFCPEHKQHALDYYCDTCDKVICVYCTVTDHIGHMHNTVEVMAARCQNKFNEVIKEVRDGLSKKKDGIKNAREILQKQAKETDENVDKCYAEQLTKLNKHHQQLKKKSTR